MRKINILNKEPSMFTINSSKIPIGFLLLNSIPLKELKFNAVSPLNNPNST
jgi:hypothetical protein